MGPEGYYWYVDDDGNDIPYGFAVDMFQVQRDQPWGEGENEFGLTVEGFSFDIKVTIEKSNIVSIGVTLKNDLTKVLSGLEERYKNRRKATWFAPQ